MGRQAYIRNGLDALWHVGKMTSEEIKLTFPKSALSILAVLVVQTLGAVWWASALTGQVSHHGDRIEENSELVKDAQAMFEEKNLSERVAVLESKLKGIREDTSEIKSVVSELVDEIRKNNEKR